MVHELRREDYTFSWGGKCFPLLFEDILAESLRQYSFLNTFWISNGDFLRVYWSKKSRVQATQYGEEVLGTLMDAKKYCQKIAHTKEKAMNIDTEAVDSWIALNEQLILLQDFLYFYIALDPEFTNDFLEKKNDEELLAFLGEQKNLFREDVNAIFFDDQGSYQRLIRNLAEKCSVDFAYVQSLSLQQLVTLFDKERPLSVQDVFFISIDQGQKEYVFDKSLIDTLLQTFEPTLQIQDQDYVRGVSISTRGVYRGRVRKVILDYANFSQELIKENASSETDFILVADHTTPELVPLMKRSIAIVTDMGGILSHAAITARELHKPCIIGTENATLLFEDGDMVEVDANNGVVRIVEPLTQKPEVHQ